MGNRNPYSYYQNQDLETSSKNELVGKLYDSAAASLNRAAYYIENRKYDGACNAIIKAENIVIVLNDALDMNFEISHQLRTLYSYMLKRMQEANVKKDVGIVNEIADLLGQFRDTWAEAQKIYKKSQSMNTGIA